MRSSSVPLYLGTNTRNTADPPEDRVYTLCIYLVGDSGVAMILFVLKAPSPRNPSQGNVIAAKNTGF
jgi:hypothetical protein